MIRPAIRGMGLIGGFGCGVADLEKRLAAAATAPGELVVPAGGKELRVPAYLADPAPLERFLSRRATRRIDHFSKMALLGAHLALEDAGALECPRERLGVVVATGYGAMRTTFAFLDSVLDDGDACASPTHFSNSVHNSAAAHVAIQLGATGPSLTVSQFEMSVASALLTARGWLAEGRVDRVLFGAVDEISTVLGYCWERFFGAVDADIRPFDFGRQSAVAGEGAAFFLLDGGEEAPYGRIADVLQGRATAVPTVEGAFILNADGHADCSARYRDPLPETASVAAYTPHYGSLPVGQAFDLAVAALALRRGQLPAVPAPQALPRSWRLAGAMVDCPALISLKCDGSGNLGAVTVERS